MVLADGAREQKEKVEGQKHGLPSGLLHWGDPKHKKKKTSRKAGGAGLLRKKRL